LTFGGQRISIFTRGLEPRVYADVPSEWRCRIDCRVKPSNDDFPEMRGRKIS
jgi:hypothetical protein